MVDRTPPTRRQMERAGVDQARRPWPGLAHQVWYWWAPQTIAAGVDSVPHWAFLAACTCRATAQLVAAAVYARGLGPSLVVCDDPRQAHFERLGGVQVTDRYGVPPREAEPGPVHCHGADTLALLREAVGPAPAEWAAGVQQLRDERDPENDGLPGTPDPWEVDQLIAEEERQSVESLLDQAGALLDQAEAGVARLRADGHV